MAQIELRQISKLYPGHTAVAPFDLTIEDGEFLVLVGPSGCGKTTTLRMIAGLETPTGGQIYIGGEDVTGQEPKNRDVAMVFQNYALYPHMTVYENMSYALKLRKIAKQEIQAAVEKTAAMLKISELLTRYPRQLSGGQQQRVALGRAIVRHPKAFLMDEPLSNLDAKLRVQTRAELIQMHRQLGATIVYVTHDQIEAMTMGSRIVVMQNGLVQQIGTPDDIYRHPANLFVAGFIGTPPMQFLSGSILTNNAGTYFAGTDFVLKLPQEYVNSSEIVLGIRPENLSLAPEKSEHTLPGIVEVVENLGSEAIIHFSTGKEKCAIKIPAPKNLPVVGQLIFAAPQGGSLYLFNKTNGQCLAEMAL